MDLYLLTAEEKVQILEQKLGEKDQLLVDKDKQLSKKDTQILHLHEQLKLALLRKYGRSSEQYTDLNQLSLFSEDLLSEDEANEIDDSDIADETTEVSPHSRKKTRGKRQPLPECLERVRVEYELQGSELVGPDGEQYIKIGEDVSEQLDIVPADVRVLQHVRFKYAVKGKEELGVRIASIIGQAIPKSVASSGLLAHIVQAKYCYHLPLYRQEQIWRELDVHIPRNSMCRWVMRLGESCAPVVEELMEQIKALPHLHIDETPVTVINEKNKKEADQDKPSHKCYMWIYTNNEAVVYDYQSSRAGICAYNMLEDYQGYIQTDAYAGYNQLFATDQRISVGCWAHARRKFTDVIKATGKSKKNRNSDQILKLIGKLYQYEKHCLVEKLTNEQRFHYRLENSEPVLKTLKSTLKDLAPKTPPQGLLGQAVAYSLNNWIQLTNFLLDGCIPIDNNEAERKIKPFTIGRKNWLFCSNSKGASASANLYSLIESAKLYHLKTFDYLKYVFEKLPQASSAKDYEQLTPKYAQHFLPKLKPKTQD